jgi:hypothetical protein
LRKVESSTLKKRGEEKARGVFHPKCRSIIPNAEAGEER